jgi:hypothetical protein
MAIAASVSPGPNVAVAMVTPASFTVSTLSFVAATSARMPESAAMSSSASVA